MEKVEELEKRVSDLEKKVSDRSQIALIFLGQEEEGQEQEQEEGCASCYEDLKDENERLRTANERLKSGIREYVQQRDQQLRNHARHQIHQHQPQQERSFVSVLLEACAYVIFFVMLFSLIKKMKNGSLNFKE